MDTIKSIIWFIISMALISLAFFGLSKFVVWYPTFNSFLFYFLAFWFAFGSIRLIPSRLRIIKSSINTSKTLRYSTFKILKNEFIDIATNRIFTANYDKYPLATDSVYAPRHVNIDIVAEKKVNLKIDYVRIEKNIPQKLSINIPPKYEPIPIKKP